MTPQIDQAERQYIISANIRSGRDTYAGRLDAWHQLGNVQGRFTTLAEILPAAGADYSVFKRQLEFQGQKVDAYATFRADRKPLGKQPYVLVPGVDGAADIYLTFLGTVGKDYKVIPHQDAFRLLDQLVGEIDGAHYETMGVLDFGRVVWAQVDPKVSIRVGDDVSDILLTAVTSHDGSKSLDIYGTGIRAVCRNTVRISSLKKLTATLRVRHTSGAARRIESFKAELAELNKTAAEFQYKLQFLAGRKVTREAFTTALDRLFPPKLDDSGKPVESTRRSNILGEIAALYESNDNNAFPEQAGTAYCLLNSITNYVDHSRSSKGDNRAESALFGSGDKLKTSALTELLDISTGLPVFEPVSVPVRK